jgi:hypothetical protein
MYVIGEETRSKEPLGRQRRWWVNNNKIDLGEAKLGRLNWLRIKDSGESSSEHDNKLSDIIKCWEILG